MQEQTIKIFLVDDHPLVRESLSTLIGRHPELTVCGEASGAAEAESGIAASEPNVAIVDIALKEGYGLELIESMHEKWPQIRILALSMFDEVSHAELTLRAGAHGYLMKTESPKQIIDAVNDVVQGKIYLSERARAHLLNKFVCNQGRSARHPGKLLSRRELEVFALLGEGFTGPQIAQKLQISSKTVHAYLARIKDKLQLPNTAQLMVEAVRWAESTGKLSRA